MTTDFNFLGIPGAPAAVRSVLKGSIYAAILDSVPAHTSLIVQALQSNLAAGEPCALVTKMPPAEFLRMADMAGANFRDDIAQGRLYLFSREGEFAANIFRRGINRFLDEFDYFQVPGGAFFLFDHAWDLFSLAEHEVAEAQALEYRNWMKAAGNTSLFLFTGNEEQVPHGILGCFNGVARINQSKTAIEFLIDFWYSEGGAMAAKAYPVLFEANGLIRIDASSERALDAKSTASPRHIALTPTLPAMLRAEAARHRLSKRERRLLRPAGTHDATPDATPGASGRNSHHRRDET